MLKNSIKIFVTMCVISTLFIHFLNSEIKSAVKVNHHTMPAKDEIVPGRILVKLKSNINKSMNMLNQNSDTFPKNPSIQKLFNAFSVYSIQKVFPTELKPKSTGFPDLSNIFDLRFDTINDPKIVAELFSKDPNVEYAEPQFIYYLTNGPNDTFFASQYYLQTIEALSAWNIQQGDSNVVIAIVDTGVEWNHPDLAANIWKNPGEIPQNGIDDDNNGYIDDIRGWDFGGNDNDPANDNDQFIASHGTWVAGTASAVTNNNAGIAGIGYRCRIMPVKAVSENAESQAKISFGMLGIKYAAENGADIINVSFGGPTFSKFARDVMKFAQAKGCLIVAAAGNENSEKPFFPAAYPEVLSVTATDENDQVADFSNFGDWIDICAPGVGILTTSRNAEYEIVSGTSISAPLVSGVAALLKSQYPNLTPDEIKEQMRVTADKLDNIDSHTTNKHTFGRLNAFKSFTGLLPSIQITDTDIHKIMPDKNEIYSSSETYEIVLTFKNFLADANSINYILNTSDKYTTILNSHSHIATINRGESKKNQNNPFSFFLSPDTPINHHIDFFIDIHANNNSYFERIHFPVVITPLHENHNNGNIILTVTAEGNLGFSDYPDNKEGSGFIFNGDGKNLLFEGAFLAGVSPINVSDVARNSYIKKRDHDFGIIPGGNLVLQKSDEFAIQQTVAQFQDKRFGYYNSGIKVTQESFSYPNPPHDDYVLLKYTIENVKTDEKIENLYTGLFLDWNIAENHTNTNLVDFDRDHNFGYMYSETSPVYCGVKVLNGIGATSYRAIDNKIDLNDNSGFTDGKKFKYLSEGFKKTKIETPGDFSHLISTGPFFINPGEKVVAGFAILAGNNLEDLKNNARAAQEKWEENEGKYLPGNPPMDFILKQNYPNPFNASTNISFNVPQLSRVNIEIYNVLGQKVITLKDDATRKGSHLITWNGKDKNGIQVADGVYFVQMRTEGVKQTTKMILIP